MDRMIPHWMLISCLSLILFTPYDRAAGNRSSSITQEPWYALHCLNYNTDSDLQELAEVIPALVDRGINTLILEVDYHFRYRSHPELRQGDEQITRYGAWRFVRTSRRHGVRLIPEFQ